MGNNTSSTRKSAASMRGAAYRKSSQSQTTHQNLEEEFSDLILHEVKRQKQHQLLDLLLDMPLQPLSEKQNSLPKTSASSSADPTLQVIRLQNKFSDDLIEDEFNELNDGLLDNDASEVLRSIIPDDASDMDVDEGAAGSARAPGVSVSVETVENLTDLLNDLTKVDFTKISAFVPKSSSHLPSSVLLRLPVPLTSTGNGQPSQNLSQSQNQVLVHAHGLSLAHEHGSSRNSFAELVPVEIKWVNTTRENIAKVAIIGSFSNWRDVIKLKRSSSHPNEYSTTVKLTLGVHKLLYIVNNEYRVLEQLPTATDQEGIFFNWFEVLDPHRLFNHSANQQTHTDATTPFDANIIQVAGEHDTLLIQKKLNSYLLKESKLEKTHHEHVEEPEYLTYHTEALLSFVMDATIPSDHYSSEIPEMFINYDYFKSKSADYELPEPPQLPAHLNNVLLNKMLANQQQNHAHNIPQVGGDPGFGKRPALRRADSSYYASNKEAYHLLIPNHVILNHLMTTSIRNDVLTVACITRYSGKFVTQIMHSPADTMTAGE